MDWMMILALVVAGLLGVLNIGLRGYLLYRSVRMAIREVLAERSVITVVNIELRDRRGPSMKVRAEAVEQKPAEGL